MSDKKRYTVVALNDGPCSPDAYAEAMSVYRAGYDDNDTATPLEQLVTWRARYNNEFGLTGDRFSMYALVARRRACGFCMIVYTKQARTLMVDYFTLAVHDRGLPAFHSFVSGIESHIKERRLDVDFVLAEHVIFGRDDERYEESIRVLSLFIFYGFRIANMVYTPPPMVDGSQPTTFRADLLVYTYRKSHTLSASQIQVLIESVFQWYERWYQPFLGDSAYTTYRKKSHAHYRRNLRQLARASNIQLVGLDRVARERSRLARVLWSGTTLGIVVAAFTVALEVTPSGAKTNLSSWPEVAWQEVIIFEHYVVVIVEEAEREAVYIWRRLSVHRDEGISGAPGTRHRSAPVSSRTVRLEVLRHK